jgi:hypothetical protein
MLPVKSSSNCVAVVATKSIALRFAQEAEAYFRSVLRGFTGVRMNVHTKIVQPAGWIPVLILRLPGWGRVRGSVCYRGDVPFGLAVPSKRTPGELVMVPIKRYNFVARTEFGSLYVRFADGEAFCRSSDDGPLPVASALYFVDATGRNQLVEHMSDDVRGQDDPEHGLYPAYVSGLYTANRMGNIPPDGCRVGSRVVDIFRT